MTTNNEPLALGESGSYAGLDVTLASFFPPKLDVKSDAASRFQYSESQIQQVADLLGHLNEAWAKVPRTYIVLRLIDQLPLLDRLIDLGFSDPWFPVAKRSVPVCLGPTAADAFLSTQAVILTKALDLEKGDDGRHMHFAKGEPIPFETKAILGAGGF